MQHSKPAEDTRDTGLENRGLIFWALPLTKFVRDFDWGFVIRYNTGRPLAYSPYLSMHSLTEYEFFKVLVFDFAKS
jgi:hypothetical protein